MPEQRKQVGGGSQQSEDARRKAEQAQAKAEEAQAAEAAKVREGLGLPADATDAEVKEAEEAAATSAQDEREASFSREDLLANSRTLTGYSRHLLAGALSGSDRKTFTVAEAKELAEAFSSRPVGEEETG